MENVKMWIKFWFACLTTNFANFKGRTTRRDFWVFMLCNSAIVSALTITGILAPIAIIVALWSIVPMFAIATRRLNDTGRSPLHHLLLLIPGCGQLVWYYLVGVVESLDETNAFGPKPTSNC